MDNNLVIAALTFAYGCTGFISIAGYMPQFKAFLQNPRVCNDSPLAMWAMWTLQGVIILTYAVFVNGDKMVILSGLLSTVVNCGGLLLVLWGRRKAVGMHTRADDRGDRR
ncbi:MAG: hypothetical protein WAZ18_06665 [Alphaproteobacteria bacterium]